MSILHKKQIRWVYSNIEEALLSKIISTEGLLVKQASTKVVTKIVVESYVFYVKRYLHWARRLRPLKYLIRKSPAKREWELAWKASNLGINVVNYLAVGEVWALYGLLESIVITEFFDGIPLQIHPERFNPTIQRAVGKFLRFCHDKGFYQDDLSHNILIKTNPIEIRLVDLYRARLKRKLSLNKRIQNIIYLEVDLTLNNAFFEGYGLDAKYIAYIKKKAETLRTGLIISAALLLGLPI